MATAARAQAEQFLSGRPPRMAGALLDRETLARGLSADTVLRRRTGHPCEVVPDGESLRLLLGDLGQGALAGVMAAAVARAAEVPEADVRRALTLSGDLAETAAIALGEVIVGVGGAPAVMVTLVVEDNPPVSVTRRRTV